MKKTIALIVSGLFTSLVVHAQDSTIAISRNKYIQVDVGIGYLNTNMSGINNSLKGLGYKSIKEHYATISVAPAFFMNRFLFRTELSLVLPNSTVQPNNIRTTFSGYTFGAGIGYAVIQTPRFKLYPYVGINSFNTSLKFTDLSPVANMDDLVNNGHRTSRIKFSNASLDLGVQLEKIMTIKNSKWSCPQNSRYMTVGARFGYNWSPGVNKARYNGNLLEGAPAYNLEGPYVKLIIGLGTKVRTLKWK